MAIARLFGTSLTLMLLLSATAVAQNANLQSEKCPGPIYNGKDVAQHAKIVKYADISVLTDVATQYDFHGTIRAEAVLCRSGRVTDIQLTQQLPRNLGEFVVAAIGTTEFKPAESNWHTVSQRIQFEFSINDNGVSPIDSAAAAGRLVEWLNIMGNRRMTSEEILALIKTRPGDIYNSDQVQKDLAALLASGLFYSQSTRVLLDDGPRGGVRVTFEVFELPLISEIRFDRLKERDQSAVLNEFAKQAVDIRKGAPLDSAKLKKATTVIERFFQSQGWINARVEAFVEDLSTTEVRVTFKISGRNF